MRTLGYAFLLALVSATWVASDAQAGERLYLFETGLEGDLNPLSRRKVDQYYRTILSMSSRVQYVTPDDARAASSGSPGAEASKPRFNPVLEEANNLLWKGKDLIQQKKWEPAMGPLTQALDTYAENFDILRDMDNLVDATFNLALAAHEAGYEENADEAIERIVVMRPELTFDRATLSKPFAARFDKIRARVLKKQSGPVTVEAGGKQVDVYVDGVLRGRAPLTLKDLPYGVHYVQVFAPGFRPWGKRFKSPSAAKAKTFEAKLVEDSSAAPAAGPQPGLEALQRLDKVPDSGQFVGSFRADARAVSQHLGVNWLLFGYVHRSGSDLQYNQFLYSAANDAVVDAGFVTFDPDLSDVQVKVLILEDQLYQSMGTLASRPAVVAVPACYQKAAPVAPPAVVVAPVVTPSGPPANTSAPSGTVTSPVVKGSGTNGEKPRFTIVPYPGGKPATSANAPVAGGPSWYKNKWVWIGVGSAVVLAGAGAGTYFLLKSGDGGSGYKATLTW